MQSMSEQWSGWRQQVIRRRRCEKRQRNIRARDTRIIQCHVTSFHSEIRERFIGSGPTARADTGSTFDPTGFKAKPGLDLSILDTSFRNIMA
jgi:hypothetical protein